MCIYTLDKFVCGHVYLKFNFCELCFNCGHVMIEVAKTYGVLKGIQLVEEKGLGVVWLEMSAKTIVAKVQFYFTHYQFGVIDTKVVELIC